MRFEKIIYEPADLVQLIKNNTAALAGVPATQLYVSFRNILQNGKKKLSAEVTRINQEEFNFEI